MSHFQQYAPTAVRARSRAAKRSNTLDYSTGEDDDMSSKTVISFYNYQRTRGNPPASNFALAIRWPLPQSFVEPNNLGFENYNLNMLGNDPARIARTISDQVKAGADMVGELGSEAGWAAGAAGALRLGLHAAATTPIFRDTGFGRAAQLRAGIVANPHTTVMFNGVPLRRYTLNWRFSPRSQKMADQLQKQIFQIKRMIYPKVTASEFALEYPNLAVVNFPGTKLPAIRKAFVESFVITNSSGNSIELYRDGTPIDFDITMSFFETEIITRDVLDGKTRGDIATLEEIGAAIVAPVASGVRTVTNSLDTFRGR